MIVSWVGEQVDVCLCWFEQRANVLMGKYTWHYLEKHLPHYLGEINPHNEKIIQIFGDQGGYWEARESCSVLFSLCLHVCSLQKWYFYLMCIILEPSEKDVPLWTAPILFESLAFCLSVPCLPLILEQKDLESPTLTWRCPHHVQLTDHYCVLVSKKSKVKVTWPRNGQARNMS